MAKRRSKKKSNTKGIGDLSLLLPALVMGVVVYFLKDATGLAYRFVGTYIWLAAYFFVFGLGLSYFAQFILPVDWKQSWFEGLRLTIRYNLPRITSFLRIVISRKSIPAATARAKPQISEGFLTHRAGMLKSHQAFALTEGSKFTRAAGPGFVSLKPREMVAQVIDLRRHLRSRNVEALTKDGIELKMSVTAIFHVKHRAETLDEKLPFPYDEDAIYQVNYLDNFSTGEGEMLWTDHVCRVAADRLVAEIALYTLDELFDVDQGDKSLFDEIKYRIQKELKEYFQKRGIDIILVGIGRAKLPESVREQRISNWESRLVRHMTTRKAQKEADEIRRLSLARARAQIEIIEMITDSITSMGPVDDDALVDVIALRTIEAIEVATSDNAVMALVPETVLSALKDIDRWIEDGERPR